MNMQIESKTLCSNVQSIYYLSTYAIDQRASLQHRLGSCVCRSRTGQDAIEVC